jgi:hypothetical protein
MKESEGKKIKEGRMKKCKEGKEKWKKSFSSKCISYKIKVWVTWRHSEGRRYGRERGTDK